MKTQITLAMLVAMTLLMAGAVTISYMSNAVFVGDDRDDDDNNGDHDGDDNSHGHGHKKYEAGN